MNGIIRRFNHARGYGFIEPLVGKPGQVADVFFHASAIRIEGRGRPSVPIGAEVRFKLVRGSKGPQAADVELVEISGTTLALK
jgi:CspA family cold shock protein